MSIIKIEYPSLASTRVGATLTHGEIMEKLSQSGAETFFFKIVRTDAQIVYDLVGVWFHEKNFGTVYDNPNPSEKQ